MNNSYTKHTYIYDNYPIYKNDEAKEADEKNISENSKKNNEEKELKKNNEKEVVISNKREEIFNLQNENELIKEKYDRLQSEYNKIHQELYCIH